MVSVGSSLFEISGLWFQLFAILPLAILSKISLLVASLFMCVVSGVDGMDSIRRMVLDAIERIVNPSDSRARKKKTTKKGKRIKYNENNPILQTNKAMLIILAKIFDVIYYCNFLIK